jgi:CRISPR/Cas system-associated exonuclease Cas4 (RecB family)
MSNARIPAHVIRERILRDFKIVGAGRARRGAYRPRLSSAGRCVRALSYHRQGYPESDPTPPQAGLRFDVGDALHLYLDAKLMELGYPLELREHEVRIAAPSGLVITGHFDRSIGGTTIVDYKSASDASFRFMADRDEPLPDHRAQVVGYLHACQDEALNPGLSSYTHGLIVALNKDTQEIWVSPPIERDPELAQAIIAKFEEVERHAQAGTLPPRPHASPHEYPCRVCPWRRLCWGETIPQEAPAARLDGAAEEAARRYLELGERIRELERDREAAAGALRAALADAGARRAEAGPYEVRLDTQTRRAIDPSLLPPEIRDAATRVSEIPTLRVRRVSP